jgi:hypothetical protein
MLQSFWNNRLLKFNVASERDMTLTLANKHRLITFTIQNVLHHLNRRHAD